MPTYTLEFEKPILELETKIQELKQFAQVEHVDFSAEIVRLEKKVARLQEEVFANLTAWQRTQIARHPNRPYALDYIRLMLTDFIELHGDRGFADDRAIVGGLARLDGMGLVVIGHQKGRDTKEKAIARNLREMSDLKVPIVVVISGEGGSGGALGIAVGDTVLMLEYAIYSVISPEGCASILWRDPAKAPEAAAAMGITAQTLKRLAVIDEIVPEPVGGAHRNHQEMATTLQGVLVKAFDRLRRAPLDELLEQRYQKFRRMGVFEEG
ncbi:MAG: acetyl-CoA carboxylase carboxyl transferase subunit alpha [candidate division NC10 bacterium]|nr:acetyl-CoA carboxylase carboxyl transferase subunit alpha [candidate division NC10 bacterium]